MLVDTGKVREDGSAILQRRHIMGKACKGKEHGAMATECSHCQGEKAASRRRAMVGDRRQKPVTMVPETLPTVRTQEEADQDFIRRLHALFHK